ncbi:MAG: hypothetical protein COB30_019675 [Ectothiorhodospiraceae bacterium]|nr:hypothetical protein [Ectothiorhodospiraceae bacterium]
MVMFTRLRTSDYLFTAETDIGSVGWIGYLLPTTIDPSTVPSPLNLADSFTEYPGTYLFSYTEPVLDTTEATTAFISSLRTALGTAGPSMVWLLDLSAISSTTIDYLSYRSDGTVAIPLSTSITSDLTFGISNRSTITIDDDAFLFSGGVALATRNGIEKWKVAPNAAYLMMNGMGRGTFEFQLYVNPRFDFDLLGWELRYCIPQSAMNPDPANVLRQSYPLIDTSKFAGNIMIQMRSRIDPTMVPDKDRTFMAFTGQDCTSLNNSGCNATQPTLLYSTFITDAGHPINLAPVGWNGSSSIDPDPSVARLVFTPADLAGTNSNVYYMTPCGNFRLGIAADFVNASAPPALLAGTSGTETIGFTPFSDVAADDGDLLSFVPYQSGYAPVFPLPETSPTGPPPNTEPLLDTKYQTAWANVIQGSASSLTVGYYSQPTGASLYNNATYLWEQTKEYLGYFETPVGIDQSAGFCFPIVPYCQTSVSQSPDSFSFDDISRFETTILNPERKQDIQSVKQPISISHTLQRRKVGKALAANVTADSTTKATTPQGLLATVDTADSSWVNLLLAVNQVTKGSFSMQFENLLGPLKNAFQSNQLLLVVTDGKNFGAQVYNDKGKPVTPAPDPTAPLFDNLMAIEEWLFSVVTPCSGESSTNKPVYDDYNNVMIFKFCKGALIDLMQSPKGWTDPLNFNDDSIGVSGLTGVSSWVEGYFDQAQKDEALYPEYLQNFCRIINDPNWNGILTLKADVASLPSDIQGLMAGVVYPENFFAHHFGIEINPVETSVNGDVALSKNSSLFGLINYLDTDYENQLAAGKGVNQPVPPRPATTYDFKVLYLQSLFVNSAVAKFGSKTQLTCNQLYSEVVSSLNDQTDTYNSMIIDGTYQNQNGKSVYVFETNGNNAYGFDSSMFNVLNFTEGQFNTVADGSDGGDVISLFSLTGKFDFKKIKDMDMFSFGSEGSASVTDPKGLAFTNVFIRMTSSSDTNLITSMLFDTASITFDVQESDTRENSLYPNFALDIKGLISGSVDSSPDSKGFLRLQSDAKITGTVGTWYALDCSLNMGSPGALASSAGFVSSMALCWSPSAVSETDGDDPSYKVYLGLKLPGSGGSAKLLSLQGVLKLTIGEMKLSYINDQQAYMMMLYDIALKFLGLIQIPPLNGRTSFYLFGGPQGSASKVSELGWYAVYNVAPTPPSDVTQKTLTTGGGD